VYCEYAITKRSDTYTKTGAAQNARVKRCEIKGGGQEMAVIIVQCIWQKF